MKNKELCLVIQFKKVNYFAIYGNEKEDILKRKIKYNYLLGEDDLYSGLNDK